MTKLQDGLMLFTRDTRVVLVSASAEKFLGRPRREILGRSAEEIFSDGTVLGAVVLPAFQKQRRWRSTNSTPPMAAGCRYRSTLFKKKELRLERC